jgi:hypothetical protein
MGSHDLAKFDHVVVALYAQKSYREVEGLCGWRMCANMWICVSRDAEVVATYRQLGALHPEVTLEDGFGGEKTKRFDHDDLKLLPDKFPELLQTWRGQWMGCNVAENGISFDFKNTNTLVPAQLETLLGHGPPLVVQQFLSQTMALSGGRVTRSNGQRIGV